MRDQESKHPTVYKSFLFGCLSGMTSTILLQPLDVVKTRLQMKHRQSMLARRNGVVLTFLHIIHNEHPLALWKGLLPSMSRVIPGVGLYFTTITFISNQMLYVDK
jgi:solute carrier family 25 protein 38